MIFGINKSRLKTIDNGINRDAVISNILGEFNKKFGDVEYSLELSTILVKALNNLDLYTLLCITEADIECLIWNRIFEDFKDDVIKTNGRARYFFHIGEQATLNGDKYYDEFHTITDTMLSKRIEKFYELSIKKELWENKVKEVVDYIRLALPTRFHWIAFSNDGSYEDESEKTFETELDCYNDMRNAVLKKMKWNTNYDEDFESSDVTITYRVSFKQREIIHESYSGIYVYRILIDDETLTKDEIFTDDFNRWLKNHNFCYV